MKRIGVALGLGVLLGCRGQGTVDPPAVYGEPVGLRLSGEGDAAPMEVAIAVSKGRDPATVVEGLGGALYKAARACRDRAGGPPSPVDLRFAIEAGIVRPAGSSPAGCMQDALVGQRVAPASTEHLDVLVHMLEPRARPGARP